MRILLLEDEESIRGFVRINLKRNGMEVTEAEDGETALTLAEEASPPFDIALLDVMLPTISGFEVCGLLRERFPRMGIIMLTAKSQEEDKIRGLELGADDYVQKPFSPGELIARVGALYRRMMPGGLSWPEGQPHSGEAAAAEAASPTAAERGANAGTAEGAAAQSGTHAGAAGGVGGAAGAAAESGAHVGAAGGVGGAAGEAAQSGAHAGAAGGVGGAAGEAAESGAHVGAAGSAGGMAGAAAESGEQAGVADGAGGAAGAAAQSGAPAGQGGSAEAGHPASGGEVAATAAPGELHSGPFRLSAAQRRLWKGAAEIVLTPTEWTLVRLLMERAGEGLSRDDILNAVWGRHFIGDLKIVDVNIRRIRQKLEDEPSEPKYIETLWGYGYRWKRSD